VKRRESSGLVWFESELAAERGARACFSTRRGGYSAGSYASLNLGLHVGDDDIAVASGRLDFWTALGPDPDSAVGMRQVHGTKVMIATATDRGRGAASWTHAIPETDGLVTLERGLPLFGLSADCYLVALAAPGGRGVAVLHAGWRGLVGGIVGRGAGLLAGLARCAPAELAVFVGPGLCENCFEVRADFLAELTRARGAAAAAELVRRDGGRSFFRYRAALLAELERAGLRRECVEEVGGCTAEDAALWYSHRASGGQTGRMAMAVWIP